MFSFGMIPIFRFSGTLTPLVGGLRVIDSMMKDAVQNNGKAPGNFVEVFKGQLTFIKLTIDKYIIDQFLDQPLDTVRRRIYKGTGGRFNTVCQHDNACLACLRLGAGIAEILFFYNLPA